MEYVQHLLHSHDMAACTCKRTFNPARDREKLSTFTGPKKDILFFVHCEILNSFNGPTHFSPGMTYGGANRIVSLGIPISHLWTCVSVEYPYSTASIQKLLQGQTKMYWLQMSISFSSTMTEYFFSDVFYSCIRTNMFKPQTKLRYSPQSTDTGTYRNLLHYNTIVMILH